MLSLYNVVLHICIEVILLQHFHISLSYFMHIKFNFNILLCTIHSYVISSTQLSFLVVFCSLLVTTIRFGSSGLSSGGTIVNFSEIYILLF